MLETLQQFTVFCDESYNASPLDLVLFVIIILNQLNIQKNKIDKDNFEKNHKKKKPCGETLQQSTMFCKESYNVFPT